MLSTIRPASLRMSSPSSQQSLSTVPGLITKIAFQSQAHSVALLVLIWNTSNSATHSFLIWTILYLTFTCLFAVNLNSWSFDEAGHCYNSSGIALRDSRHPHVDYLYITLTCLYVFLLADNHSFQISLRENEDPCGDILASLCCSPIPRTSFGLLVVAMIQYPLHMYTLFTLRANVATRRIAYRW